MKRTLVSLVVFLFVATLNAQQVLFQAENVASNRDSSRFERVNINPGALLQNFSLEIDGKKLDAIVEEIEERGNDVVSRFRVGDAPVSTVSYYNGQMAGIVYLEDGRKFQVLPGAEGHFWSEVSDDFKCYVETSDLTEGFRLQALSLLTERMQKLETEDPMEMRTESDYANFAKIDLTQGFRIQALSLLTASLASSKQRSVNRTPNYVIGLNEYWTPQAETYAGGRIAVEAQIRNAVDALNTAMRNSGITNVTYKLLYAGLLNVIEGPDTKFHLNLLATNEEVKRKTNETGARLSGLWTDNGGAAAYLPLSNNFNPSLGFHVLPVSAPASDWKAHDYQSTFAHEVGHNHGAQHDWANAKNFDGDPNIDGRGWYDCMSGWSTLMSYETDVCKNLSVARPKRILHFSNPDVKYNGLSTGIPGKANNARVIRNSLPFISRYTLQ